MPAEETEKFIHTRVLNPDQFETCRLTDFDGKLPEGVRAKYCKYKGRDEWAVQAYIFEEEKGWTLEKALNWVKSHRGFGFGYYVAAAPREEGGRFFVDIQVIDTTRNANNWRVTDEALGKALVSLIGVPLLAYPDHSGSIKAGYFVTGSKPDGYAMGTVEITDSRAWEKIKSGEWKWVSPQVYAFETHEEDGCEVVDNFAFEHIAFVPNPAYQSTRVLNATATEGLPTFSAALTNILEEKRRNKMSKQSMPAYRLAPENTEWNFNEASYTPEQLRRACAWYAGHDPDLKQSYKLPHHLPDGTLVWMGVRTAMTALLGGRGGVDIPESDRRGVYNRLAAHYKEYSKEPPEYQASQFQNNQGTASQSALETGKQNQKQEGEEKTLSQDIATLQTKVTELTEQNKTLTGKNTELETTVKTLKASLDEIASERHIEKVQKLLELRAKVNLFDASKRGDEEGRLGKLSDQVLDQLIVDTENIIKALPRPSGPKATYTAEQTIDNEERVRERLFGYRRDKDGKIVAGGA